MLADLHQHASPSSCSLRTSRQVRTFMHDAQQQHQLTPSSRSRLKFTSRPLRSGALRARARSLDRLPTRYVVIAGHCVYLDYTYYINILEDAYYGC